MEFRQLRYASPWPRSCTSAEAAKRLQISRPPLSQQILALERELGVELLIRGRNIELTEAGRVLLEHGRSASEAVTYAVQAAAEAGEHDQAAGRVSGQGFLGVGAAGRPDLPRAVPLSRPRYGGRAGRRAPRGPGRPSGGRGLRAPGRRQRRQPGLPAPAPRARPCGHPRAAPAGPGCAPSGLGISPTSRSSLFRGARPAAPRPPGARRPGRLRCRAVDHAPRRPRWRAAWSRSLAG